MPLPTDDIVAIQQLVARYAFALDSGDEATLLEIFTEDAVCWTGPEGNERVGVEGIRAMARGTVVGKLWHFIANLVIDGDGDNATAKAYLQMVRELGREPMIGRYDLTLVRQDGHWRIKRRDVDGVPRLRRAE